MVKKADLPPAHADSIIIIPNIRAHLVAGRIAEAAEYFCGIFAVMGPTTFTIALDNTLVLIFEGGLEGLLTNEALITWLASARSLAERNYWMLDIGTKPSGVVLH